MAQTYFNETFVFGDGFIPFPYRWKKIKNKFILTTDHGGWIALDKKEFDALQKDEIKDKKLFHILEDKGIIITEHNINIIKDNYLERFNSFFDGTSLHIIVPTLRCNHKCIYCHSAAREAKDKSFDMTEETAKKVLDFIFQTPSNSITIEFQGGDALINPKIFKFIVKKAKKMNTIYQKKVNFSLVTNLTMLNEEIIKFILEEKVDVCSSLDGPKAVHDCNRKYESGNGTYDDVVGWIKMLKKDYDKSIGLLGVTTKKSFPYYKEIVDEYVKCGSKSIQVKYLNKLGSAEDKWNEIGYTVEEFIDFWKKTVDYIMGLNKKGIAIQERTVSIILKKILTKNDASFLDIRSPCGIVIGQLAYDYNGDIFCCDEGRAHEIFKLGSVYKDSYKEVISSQKSQQLISASICENYICDNCAYKPYCGVCPVMAYAEQGNIMPKIPTFSKCKLLKAQFDYVFEKLLFDNEAREIFFGWIKRG